MEFKAINDILCIDINTINKDLGYKNVSSIKRYIDKIKNVIGESIHNTYYSCEQVIMLISILNKKGEKLKVLDIILNKMKDFRELSDITLQEENEKFYPEDVLIKDEITFEEYVDSTYQAKKAYKELDDYLKKNKTITIKKLYEINKTKKSYEWFEKYIMSIEGGFKTYINDNNEIEICERSAYWLKKYLDIGVISVKNYIYRKNNCGMRNELLYKINNKKVIIIVENIENIMCNDNFEQDVMVSMITSQLFKLNNLIENETFDKFLEFLFYDCICNYDEEWVIIFFNDIKNNLNKK